MDISNMIDARITPGPWEWKDRVSCDSLIGGNSYVIEGRNINLNSMRFNDSQLISLVPELFEVYKAARELIDVIEKPIGEDISGYEYNLQCELEKIERRYDEINRLEERR